MTTFVKFLGLFMLTCGMVELKEADSSHLAYSSISFGVMMSLLALLGFCVTWLIKVVKIQVFYMYSMLLIIHVVDRRSRTTWILVSLASFFLTKLLRISYSLLLILSAVADLIMTGIVSNRVTKSNECQTCRMLAVLVTLAVVFAISCIFQIFCSLFTFTLIWELRTSKCPLHYSTQLTRDTNDNVITSVHTGAEYKRDYTEVVIHDPLFSVSSSLADKQYKSYSHHHSIDDSISSRAKRQGIAFLDSDDITELQHHYTDRSKSCDNLSTPRHEIRVSLVSDQMHESFGKQSLVQVNVEPCISVHLPADNVTSHRSSLASDYCRMDIGDFKDSCTRTCDDSVFLDMPDTGYSLDNNFNHTSFQSEILGMHYSSINESDRDMSYGDYRTRQRSRYSSDYLHSVQNTSVPNLRGKVYKKKLPREVSKQRLQMFSNNEMKVSPTGQDIYETPGIEQKHCEYGKEDYTTAQKLFNNEEVFFKNEDNKRKSLKKDKVISSKAHPISCLAYMSLPGLHLGENFLSVKPKDNQPRAKSMEGLHTMPDFNTIKRPRSVAEGMFPPLSRAESSTQTLMKSIFSGTYWKDNGPDNSISSFDGFNSLMTSKSSIANGTSFQKNKSVGFVSKDDSSVLSKSCCEINNTTDSSGFGRSFLRKSVIDPSVVQSFQRSLHLSQTPNYLRTPSYNNYTTPQQGSECMDSQTESSFNSFHSAQLGEICTRKTPQEKDVHDITDISMPSYNFDQQLDNCLNQMMVLAAELQNKENNGHYDEAGVEVSPLMKRKSKSFTNIGAYIRPQSRDSIASIGRPHSVNSHISTVYRPKSRDSGSVTSQCSGKGTPTHNNSRFSADSMII